MNSGIWRHKCCLDIDCLVHKLQYRGDRYLKVRMTLFNRHNNIAYETKTFKIFLKDLPMWTRVI